MHLLAFPCPRAPMRVLIALLAALALMASLPVAASAVEPSAPGWAIQSAAVPTVFTPGTANDGYFLTITNVGTRATSGVITVTDTLPPGVRDVGVQRHGAAAAYEPGAGSGENEPISCSSNPSSVYCVSEASLQPGGVITVHVLVEVTGAGTATLPGNHVEVSGGGAAPVAATGPTTTVGGPPASFGVRQLALSAFAANGEPLTQAGAHPGSLLTTISYNTVLDHRLPGQEYEQVAEPKLENVNLPMGLIGDALAAPRCTTALLAAGHCPSDTRVGVIGLYNAEGNKDEFPWLYNITPEAGYPAQFGFNVYETVVMLRPRVLPSSSGYVLSVPVPAVPRSEAKQLHEVSVMFFGDPETNDGAASGEAMFTNPVDCSAGPLDATLEMNAWLDPSDWQSAATPMFAASSGEALTGCEALQFDPSVQVTPETTTTDTPSGYQIDATVPQNPNFEGDLATAELKNAVLTFPAGVSISPSAANGLAACKPTGPEGIELGNHDQLAADRLAQEGIIQEGEERGYKGNEDGLVHAAPGHCPHASQVGEAEVKTPLLQEPLKGHLYVAEPECGNTGQPQCTTADAEDGKLFGLYLELAGSGIVIKLKGQVSVNPTTGQITTTFNEAPQLPFSELKVKIDGGQRAPLANPQTCTTFTTNTSLTPWSTPWTPTATPSSSFDINGCTGGFTPGFEAGTVNPAAGTYSPFTLTFSRKDGEQDLSGLTVNMPQGLVGKIAGIAQCGEAEVNAAKANTGSCPAASRLGSATAAAGAGTNPFWQTGSVYLTGPYNGAPFGLAVVVPANAGPFHLGNIVVRAAIHINPETAAVTVVSDPLPQMIDGVPLRVKTVNVTVGEGTDFTFNPTSCEAKTLTATITSTQGTAAGVSTPYAATGCNALPFKPTFTVSTQGAASRSNGASLDVKITTNQGPDEKPGSEEANIRKVDVQLPIDLPSRLTTLQKACTEKQFAANPAGCPEASFVGTAVAHTPLLPVPLEGPAILVSHGGAAFPNLELVLQGDGVLIDLSGETDIKGGITYSKFEAAPDAPISSFELKLPEGPHSILGAYVPTGGYSFCNLKKYVTTTTKVHGKTKKTKKAVAATLEMPTTITAQNGAVLKQTTKIAVAGCPTAAAAKKATAARKAAAAKRAQAAHRARRRK